MPAKKAVPKSTAFKRIRNAEKRRFVRKQKGLITETANEKKEIEAKPITKLGEYIDIIEKYCESDYILFRGQNSDWPLIPKLCRINMRAGSMLDTERLMLEDFKRLSKPFLSKVPTNDWEWIALAQHHGLPTRLLDWSSNPLAALWFAVSEPCSSGFGIVWIFFLERNHFLTPTQLNEIEGDL
jgi:hypothetical protein